MQNTIAETRSAQALYRERLTPSLWVFVSAAALAPMAMLVFVPLGGVLPLVVGLAVGVAIIALLVLAAPIVEVRGGELRAGRAHIPVGLLGTAVALREEEARHARGPGLDPRGWHLFRGGVEGVVVVAVEDHDDPTTTWAIASRTPDRLIAAIRRAQRETV